MTDDDKKSAAEPTPRPVSVIMSVIGDCGFHSSVEEWQKCPLCEASLRRALSRRA